MMARLQGRSAALATVVVAALCWTLAAPDSHPAAAQLATLAPGAEAAPVSTVPGDAPPPPTLTAAGAVLWDPQADVLLVDVAARQPRPMASTTKIMTVLLALEALDSGRVPATATVSAEAAAFGRIPGAASLGLTEGQELPLVDLLAADLLRSGNDAAVAIAEHVAGSETAFVNVMNSRARDLGLTATTFLDSTGLTDDPGHHASPLDLARLGAVAMAHPDFAAWAGADTLTIPPFGTLENRNELIGSYPGATGIKTGFTTLAGQTLVASATREGRTLYAVVLGSEDRAADTTALFDYGFEAFVHQQPLAVGDPVTDYRVGAADVGVVAGSDLGVLTVAGLETQVQVLLQPAVPAPIAAGQALGRAELVASDATGADASLHAIDLVADGPLVPGERLAGHAVADALRAYARLPQPAGP